MATEAITSKASAEKALEALKAMKAKNAPKTEEKTAEPVKEEAKPKEGK